MRSNRPNLATHSTERWSPPRFHRASGPALRLLAWIRRLADLQAASIWRDLKIELRGASGVVVDVGCGAQPYRELLGANAEYRGIDREAARTDFGYELPDTLYYAGDRWPVDSETVDSVVCTEVLEHVENPLLFLGEARRVLRPDGHLTMTVPFAARWHYVPHDYWRFTPSGLERLLSAAGLDRIEVYARGNAVTVASQKFIALFAPLFLGRNRPVRVAVASVAFALVFLPLVLVAIGIGTVSLAWDGEYDCLGYTVRARRPAASERSRQNTAPAGESPNPLGQPT